MFEGIDRVINRPNFKLSVEASQRILQLQDEVLSCILIVSLKNETAGSVIILEAELTEQAKLNILLETMNKFNIPFKQLKRYGNLDRNKIGVKGEI